MVWFDLATKLGGKQKGLHFHTQGSLAKDCWSRFLGRSRVSWTEYNNPGTIGTFLAISYWSAFFRQSV